MSAFFMTTSWPCPLCKRKIRGARAKATHHKNLWKARDDASRCDNQSHANVPIICTPVFQTDDESVAGPATATFAVQGFVNDEPNTVSVYDLARRQVMDLKTARTERNQYTIPCASAQLRTGTFNMLRTQNAWDRQVYALSHAVNHRYTYAQTKLYCLTNSYNESVYRACSPEFWSFFLPLHRFSAAAIDAALGAAKKNFLTKGTIEWDMFPPSKRAFLKKANKVTPFWPTVSHETTIDVSDFALPSGLKEMKFSFIDPIWGWLMAAGAQHPLDLHWKCVQQSSQPVYGGGVQYGKAFAHACASCPPGTLYVLNVMVILRGYLRNC